jgi:hypothetical protein
MEATSLWQPWASLWLSQRKIHETRHWPMKHRGWLLVHAAQRFVKDVEPELEDILCDEFCGDWTAVLPTGALIGMVHVVDCQTTVAILDGYGPSAHWTQAQRDNFYCGDFLPFSVVNGVRHERYGFAIDNAIKFDTPIPYKGRQSKTFKVPDFIIPEWARIRAATHESGKAPA